MSRAAPMIVYNLFPLLAGPFPSWKPHLQRAVAMGFNWLFVNPIQRAGRSGSLYSIADYFDFDPRLVEPDGPPAVEQVRGMARAAQDLGMDLMIDLVVNHCSIDASILREHPEWIVWEGKGRAAHPFAMQNGRKVVWGDLARIDHSGTRDKEGLFQFFVRVAEYFVELGFRGFRCDAAYQVPRSFWTRLISDVKSRHPEVVFAAETLGCPPDLTRRTASAGFDYIFNSAKWWDFRGHWLMEQYDLTREIAPSISFPESHDTQRLFDESQGNEAVMRQRYLFVATFSGGVMMPVGYEFGFRNRLHVVKSAPSDWEQPNIDLTDFIRQVNELKAKHPVFHADCPTHILESPNPQVLLMWKASTSSREEALLILNKDPARRQRFAVEQVSRFVQAGAPLVDVSPGDTQLEHIPTPFEYELRPGEGRVLITSRDALPDE